VRGGDGGKRQGTEEPWHQPHQRNAVAHRTVKSSTKVRAWTRENVVRGLATPPATCHRRTLPTTSWLTYLQATRGHTANTHPTHSQHTMHMQPALASRPDNSAHDAPAKGQRPKPCVCGRQQKPSGAPHVQCARADVEPQAVTCVGSVGQGGHNTVAGVEHKHLARPIHILTLRRDEHLFRKRRQPKAKVPIHTPTPIPDPAPFPCCGRAHPPPTHTHTLHLERVVGQGLRYRSAGNPRKCKRCVQLEGPCHETHREPTQQPHRTTPHSPGPSLGSPRDRCPHCRCPRLVEVG
jgi:hypothetical protein